MSLFRRIVNIVRSEIENRQSDIPPNQGEKSYSRGDTYRETETFTSTEDSVEKNYRANLEVGPYADLKEIRASYKALVKRYHPDLYNKDNEKSKLASEILAKLNEAMAYFEKKEQRSNS